MTRALLSGAAILIALAGGAAAVTADHHEASSSPDEATWADCEGPVSVLRENELTETGSVAGFLEAARGHQAWLDSKGYDVRIRTWTAFEVVPEEERPGKQIAFGGETIYPSFQEFSEVMATREQDREEDAYVAYVKKYRDNTKIKAERLICSSE